MPRNFHRKDRRHNKVPVADSAAQLSLGWNQSQAHKQKNRFTPDTRENYPKLGQHVVSSPNANAFSQKHRAGSTRHFPSYQRDRTMASGGEPTNHRQKSRKLSLVQPSPRAFMLSNSEIMEYLLQAVEEGKRRMDEWIIADFEQASIPEKDIIIWEACAMDWQPEKTVVIPQAVKIRYPWDSAVDIGKERWRKRSGVCDEVDGME